MKKLILIICFSFFFNSFAQDHYSGINTSQKVGILKANINPAELSNLDSKYEISFFSTSVTASNNIISFSDIKNGEDIANLLFNGEQPVNMRIDTEILGPGFAMKKNKWAWAISTKAYAKTNLVDVNPQLANGINLGLDNLTTGSTTISSDYNQRANGTSWGELGFSLSRILTENEKHKFNAGATVKLLFPGSYTNMGLDQFQGTINTVGNEAYLNNTQANLNIAYSQNLEDSFSSFKDYSEAFFGQLNGFSADFGVNYRLKDNDSYKVNTGISIRNIGNMTFNNPENSTTNYKLKIEPTAENPNGLAVTQFLNATNIQDIETILLNNGYLQEIKSNKDFKVKMPTVITFYTDVKLYSKFFMSLYTQQKIGNDSENTQITTQNVISITPRFSLKNFEIYSAWANNEISGTTGGLGFIIYGFYMGSSSILTALASDPKQGDFYLGYRLALK